MYIKLDDSRQHQLGEHIHMSKHDKCKHEMVKFPVKCAIVVLVVLHLRHIGVYVLHYIIISFVRNSIVCPRCNRVQQQSMYERRNMH